MEMLSPTTYSASRQAPPMRPSRSLEGLEQVIPPRTPISPVRPTLYLDKPLPELPRKELPDTPSFIGSTAWSDDSSTVDSFNEDDDDDDDDDDSRRQSSISTESLPVFVRSGSDDLADLVDHPSVPTLDRASVEPYEKPGTSSLALTAFLAEGRYGRPPHWNPNRVGPPNHYFREKKWDFFPELATPTALQHNSLHRPTNPRKKDSGRLNLPAFDFSKNRARWTSADSKSGLTLAHDVRNSIRSYVQRRLSKNSVERNSPKRKTRPATAPSEYTRVYTPSQRNPPSTSTSYRSDRGGSTAPQTPLEAGDHMIPLSLSVTTSSTQEILNQQKPIPYHRKKQLAVQISPYQKYGAAIWDKSGREKRISYRQHHNVRFPKYRKNTPKQGFVSSATPPLRPPPRSQLQQSTRDCVRALQDGTSQVLVAIDGARKKMIGSRVDRRRTQLKSQIRLIGPVNPYTTYGRVDPWI